ncbi:MAG: hypothetical protein AAF530_02815 [Pseudomonadota bacterium]
MGIKYISEHHSEDDPGGLIKEVIDLGDAFPGPAQDIVLAWLLRLGSEQDAGAVAQRLIQDYDVAEGDLPPGACGELVKLLRETAEYGRDQLDRHLAGQGRRGGRAGRAR